MPVSECMYAHQVCALWWGDQKSVSGPPPGIVLEAAVSHYVGAGTKLQSSARVVSALNH